MRDVKGFPKKVYAAVTVIAMVGICVAGAVVLALPMEQSAPNEYFVPAFENDTDKCQSFSVESSGAPGGLEAFGLDDMKASQSFKHYDSWGIVRRSGVVTPVITLYNAHTRETLPIFEAPRTKPELLRHFFRCRGFGRTVDMAPALMDTILLAAKHFDARRATIISGYRSPKFNDTLAKKGRRVASESRHMKGEAVDFRLDTVDAKTLGPWLRDNFEGGVGTYRADNFVHIDVGPKRSWQGH